MSVDVLSNAKNHMGAMNLNVTSIWMTESHHFKRLRKPAMLTYPMSEKGLNYQYIVCVSGYLYCNINFALCL